MRKSQLAIIICFISAMLLAGCKAAVEGALADAPETAKEDTEMTDDSVKETWTGDMQYEANAFLSSFIEQTGNNGQAYSITADADEIEPLLGFAFRYTDMHCADDFAMNGSDFALTLAQVNELLDRFFGITLTEAQALNDIYYDVS